MVSFQIKGQVADIDRFIRRLQVITFGASLGGVESLLCHPASTTHRFFPREIREARGINDTLLRLSVGLEDSEDLLMDIDQPLNYEAYIPQLFLGVASVRRRYRIS